MGSAAIGKHSRRLIRDGIDRGIDLRAERVRAVPLARWRGPLSLSAHHGRPILADFRNADEVVRRNEDPTVVVYGTRSRCGHGCRSSRRGPIRPSKPIYLTIRTMACCSPTEKRSGHSRRPVDSVLSPNRFPSFSRAPHRPGSNRRPEQPRESWKLLRARGTSDGQLGDEVQRRGSSGGRTRSLRLG